MSRKAPHPPRQWVLLFHCSRCLLLSAPLLKIKKSGEWETSAYTIKYSSVKSEKNLSRHCAGRLLDHCLASSRARMASSPESPSFGSPWSRWRSWFSMRCISWDVGMGDGGGALGTITRFSLL